MELAKDIYILGSLALLLISLWSHYHGRLRLQVKGRHSRLRVFPTTVEQIREFKGEIRTAVQNAELQRELARIPPSAPLMSRSTGPHISDSILQKLPADIFGDLDDYGIGRLLKLYNCWTIEIRNAGRLEVKELILNVPFDGVYLTNRPQSSLMDFDKEIKLDLLRSKGEVTVTLWTDSIDNRGIHLTHANGSVPVALGVTCYGRIARIISEFQRDGVYWLAYVAMFFVIGAVCGFVILHDIFHHSDSSPSGQTQQAVTQPTTTATTR